MKLTDRKRIDILDAAIAEFSEKGFLGARTTRIAKRAKVSSRTLYKHFESKEALFSAIVDITFSEAANIPSIVFDRDQPVRDQLIGAVGRYLDVITTDHMLGLARMTLAEFLRDPELGRQAFAQVTAHDDPITTFITHAMEEGVLRKDDPQIASIQITSMVKALFHAPLMFLGKPKAISKPRDTAIADCVDMFLRHYRA